MKNPQTSVEILLEVFRQSKGLRETLKNFRTILGRPDATANECEEYAENLLTKIEPSQPKRTRKSKTSSIALGRQQVLQGHRPKLVDAIAQVMGRDHLTCPEIIQRLEHQGWMPVTKNPTAYISYVLSDSSNIFVRVRHGLYRLKNTHKSRRLRRALTVKPNFTPVVNVPDVKLDLEQAEDRVRQALKDLSNFLKEGLVLPSPMAALWQSGDRLGWKQSDLKQYRDRTMSVVKTFLRGLLAFEDLPYEVLGIFSSRTVSTFERLKVKTVPDVLNLTRERLSTERNFSRKSMAEVTDILKCYGLTFLG